MKRTTREIERYVCEDDDGRQYIVIAYQHFLISEAMGRPPEEVPGLKECRLSDGGHVNVVGDGLFKIVETDTIIREV